MTAANIRRHSSRFLFLQNPDDLLIAEPAAFDWSVPLRNRLYRKLATFQGGTSESKQSSKNSTHDLIILHFARELRVTCITRFPALVAKNSAQDKGRLDCLATSRIPPFKDKFGS
jgi:hypothetical protein